MSSYQAPPMSADSRLRSGRVAGSTLLGSSLGEDPECAGDDAEATWLQHLCSLSVDMPPSAVRRTGIICTIGPVCRCLDTLSRLLEAGVTVVRLNMSHGSPDEHAESVALVREAARRTGRQPAVAVDTRGPEIRTGTLPPQYRAAGLELRPGDEVRLTANSEVSYSSPECVLRVDYPHFARHALVGGQIQLDDGLMTLRVTALDPPGSVLCRVEEGGRLGSHKSVSLAGVESALPAVTSQDRSDLSRAVGLGVDFVFASFVRDAEGVQKIRDALGEAGRHIPVVAKIESLQGVHNIDSILTAADGVMVARGDLGVAIGAHKVFLAQKSIIAKCNRAGKPVICATQLLQSMTSQSRPTRAELSDCANAVLDGADCLMLSAETASGAFPEEAVTALDAICRQAETALWHQRSLRDLSAESDDAGEVLAAKVVRAALHTGAAAIAVLASDGGAGRQLARLRPCCPVLVVTEDAAEARRCRLHAGLVPVLLQGHTGPAGADALHGRGLLEAGLAQAHREGLLQQGDLVLIYTYDSGASHVENRIWDAAAANPGPPATSIQSDHLSHH